MHTRTNISAEGLLATCNDVTTTSLSLSLSLSLSPTTEETVFRVLDSLRPTATGLDRILAWFLRLGASIFSGPIAQL